MQSGDRVADRFVIEQRAGSGGMGEVYRALDRQTGQAVAIKVLLDGRAGDVQRFEREARLLSQIQHPNIVRYVAQGSLPSGDPYLAMEWLEGEDLSDRLSRRPLNSTEAVTLGIGLADALGTLHERGIVHRDLKPSNVFLIGGNIENLKLLDFGIAQTNLATRLTGTGMILGTFPYMAPEQASGAQSLDARADVFSLGCVLFESLAGEKAFDGAHPMAILTKILLGDPPRLQEKCPGLSDRFCNLVNKMLAKAPDERFAHGKAVAAALREIGTIERLQTAEGFEASNIAALTTSEQRAVALIFIGAAKEGAPGNDEQFLAEAKAHGGRFERLFDGTGAILLSGSQVATDLAAKAARCALSLQRQAEGRRIALVMGRSGETRQFRIDPAIDRGTKLLGTSNTEQVSSEYPMLDEATVGLLDARFEVLTDAGGFILRGERDINEVRTLLGKPTPCVGRDREIRSIVDTFDECISEGQARATLVTGPAGIGKSRIGREIVQRLRARGEPVSIWIARAELLGAGSALGMLGELVRVACAIKPGESLEVRRDKLGRRVNERLPEDDRKRVTEFLGEVAGVPFPDEDNLPLRTARQDAQLMSEQIRTAFIDFVRAECEVNPVFVMLEDLHWGDGATVRILDAALGELQDNALFVLALARPEVHDVFPKLWTTRGFEEKRLQQLGKKASEQLARYVLGKSAGQEAVDRIVQLAEGNAFYLEELIRAMAEGKLADLPETVVAMVESRVAGLPEMQRRILRAGSIFGETFWAAGIAALLGDGVYLTNAQMRLGQLVDQEFIMKRRESRFGGQIEYAFRHALVREAAYVMLTDDDRRLGHQLAAVWLEQHGERDSLLLAGHFQKGGNGQRAAEHYIRAAKAALDGGDADAAIRIAQKGLDAGASREIRIELLGLVCEATMWTVRDIEQGASYAADILQTAEAGSLPWMQAASMTLTGAMASFRIDTVFSLVERVLDVEPAPGAGGLMVALLGLGLVYLDFASGVRITNGIFERTRALADRIGEREDLARFWFNFNASLRYSYANEDPWRTFECTSRAQELAKAMGHARNFGLSQHFHGAALAYLGAWVEAEAVLRSVTIADHEAGLGAPMRPLVLGWIHAHRGDLDGARAHANGMLEAARLRGEFVGNLLGHRALAEISLLAGELEVAEQEIQQALAIPIPLERPALLGTLAAICLAQGKHVEALAAAEQGMAEYATMGACGAYFKGACLRLVHAESLKANGRDGDAALALTTTKSWLLDIAAKIKNDDYRTSFLENVPENHRILKLAEQWGL